MRSAVFFALFLSLPAYAQVVVQPGAPGKPTRTLATTTNAVLPPVTKKDIEFMQGMIMHHQQAVDMVALIAARTDNKELSGFGARISQTQSAEINFMKRWLEARGQKTAMPSMGDMKMPDHGHHEEMLMPGMLSADQMKALANAKGAEFDRLFLEGMIQHHAGALVMVDDLFTTPGAGQDAELFTFATDIDSTQRAEIRIMKTMLGE